jgi:hypothetical protein
MIRGYWHDIRYCIALGIIKTCYFKVRQRQHLVNVQNFGMVSSSKSLEVSIIMAYDWRSLVLFWYKDYGYMYLDNTLRGVEDPLLYGLCYYLILLFSRSSIELVVI